MNALKNFLLTLLLLLCGVAAADQPIDIVVYRSPSCSCCEKWLAHLTENNFAVKDIVTDDIEAIKTKYGVPEKMASCHTAIVNGYVIEGHVPVKDIMTLLKNKPKVIGIAVPGMVTGSPGMEMGDKKDPYDVMSFDKEHHYQIFNSYKGNE